MNDLTALPALAERINAEHAAAESAARSAVLHARQAGEYLLQAKAQCRHGDWLSWLAANVRFSERTAQGYMRVAEHWPELVAKAQHVADLPFRKVVQLLADPVNAGGPAWTKADKERRTAVLRGQTVTANLRTDERLIRWADSEGLLVRIDRATDWGNPFVVDEDGDRPECCEKFGVYLEMRPSLLRRLPELRGKVLACWCCPEQCHGDCLAARANKRTTRPARRRRDEA
jgi:hypothetical protein